MNVTPKSAADIARAEKERAEAMLIPNKTECDFEVMEARDETSKAGNEMIHLKLHVFHGQGYKILDDYLLDAMEAKLRHFCEATGLLSRYEAGQLKALDCVSRCGKVIVRVKKADKDYPAKNEVRDYVVEDSARAEPPAPDPAPAKEDEDSALPF